MTAAARFERGQVEELRARVSIEAVIGRVVKLRKAGRRFTGLCPFHAEKSPSFSVTPADADRNGAGFYHCFGCGAHGDAIAFVMATQGIGFVEAVERLAADGGLTLSAPLPPKGTPRTGRVRGDGDLVTSAAAGRWIFRSSRPARGTIVERWLSSRGLCIEAFGLGDGIDRLRFHPDCPVTLWGREEAPERHWLRAPAMVAPVQDGEGHVRAVHVTYLSPSGTGKAELPRRRDGSERMARKMFGGVGGGAVWLSGGVDAGPVRPLVVGEGIETCWAYAQSIEQSVRVAAALSLENLQGGIERLSCRDGSAWRLWRITADRDRPPFLIHRAGAVTILVDADMKPLRDQLIQRQRGGRIERGDISGVERAAICAAAAVQHWRNAGAAPVRAVRPPVGMDFNDMVRVGR